MDTAKQCSTWNNKVMDENPYIIVDVNANFSYAQNKRDIADQVHRLLKTNRIHTPVYHVCKRISIEDLDTLPEGTKVYFTIGFKHVSTIDVTPVSDLTLRVEQNLREKAHYRSEVYRVIKEDILNTDNGFRRAAKKIINRINEFNTRKAKMREKVIRSSLFY